MEIIFIIKIYHSECRMENGWGCQRRSGPARNESNLDQADRAQKMEVDGFGGRIHELVTSSGWRAARG